MNLPPVRFTVQTLTIVVAVTALTLWIVKVVHLRRENLGAAHHHNRQAVIARAQAGAVLLVANRLESTLTFVDVATGRALGTTYTGYHPHDIAVTPDGRTAFVANYGVGESVSVIDVATRRELRKIDLGLGRDPLGIHVSRDGTKLYVTPEAEQAVLEIDLATEKVVRTLKTGQEVSRMFVLAPDGQRLYTVNTRNGIVTVLDLDQGAAVAQIATRSGCEGIDVTPDGRAIWTANTYADTVTVIDTNTLTVVANLPCPGRPSRLKIMPDGKTAVVLCPRSGFGALVFFDVDTRRVTRNANAGPTINLAIDPAGHRVYLARIDILDRVAILDLDRWDYVGPMIMTGRGPDGLAIAVPR